MKSAPTATTAPEASVWEDGIGLAPGDGGAGAAFGRARRSRPAAVSASPSSALDMRLPMQLAGGQPKRTMLAGLPEMASPFSPPPATPSPVLVGSRPSSISPTLPGLHCRPREPGKPTAPERQAFYTSAWIPPIFANRPSPPRFSRRISSTFPPPTLSPTAIISSFEL